MREKNIQFMVHYIDKGKNLKTKPIDLSNKNKCMAYCSELAFGMLSYSSYIDLEKMKIVHSIVEKNEYKLFGTKSKKRMINAFRLLKIPLFIGFLKILAEKNKIYSDDGVLEEELLKYIELNLKKR